MKRLMKTCWLHFHSFFWDLELTFIPKNMVKNCMLKLISSFLCHDLELVCRLKLTLKITISSHICFLNEISFVEIFYIISEACLAYFSNNFGGSLLFSRFRITSFYFICRGEMIISPKPQLMSDEVLRREASKIKSGLIGK